MRCISPHARYSIQVIEGRDKIITDAGGYGTMVTVDKPVLANFDQTGLLDYEIEAALENFSFSGLAEGVNPLTKISSFDTEAFVLQYPKNERSSMLVQINQRLRELQTRFPNDFIIVDPPQAPRPWPSYDEDSVEEILAFQERLRVEPDEIRLYELQNEKRKTIVQAMLAKTDPEAAEKLAAGEEPENEVPVEGSEVIEVAS
jgi:hypothetical protein